MNFRIADTFTDALARLTGEEQKAVQTTAFDLQMNVATPGLSFHKLDKAKDKNFWSVRVSGDLRIIVHKTADSLLLCYVHHHDKAYAWAERRKLEVHPTTGAAQLVEMRETVVEIAIPKYVESAVVAAKPSLLGPLFDAVNDAQLMSYGVPTEWVADVRAATDITLFDVLAHLPGEAAEALLELATGGTPLMRVPAIVTVDPFEHPDAKRRFRVMTNADDLERAMAWPWDRWSVFLHPAQRELVERTFNGPARVAGSAGTGKTVVALHRAVHLARQHSTARVLLTTFSIPLARMLRQKLRRLTDGDAKLEARITVDAVDEVGIALYEKAFGTPRIATAPMIRTLLNAVSAEIGGHTFSERFVEQEWTDVVDAWQLTTWEGYRDVARLGRKQRLAERQREALWKVFTNVLDRLHKSALVTQSQVHSEVVREFTETGERPFDFVVVDEAQDVNVSQLRLFSALGAGRPDALFFAGDQGQRIFQLPFSWKSLGVDVRGRSQSLRVNYRTSHQIRGMADRLIDSELADVDGIAESRRGTVSVFNGPMPEILLAETQAAEEQAIASWLRQRIADGVAPGEIGVFVRSRNELERAQRALSAASLPSTSPAPGVDAEPGKVVLMPMHLAKGLEFRAVVIAACDDDVVPLQERIESVTDESDLEEVYNTERYLLYVACTRARDMLLVTAVTPGSEFLADFSQHR